MSEDTMELVTVWFAGDGVTKPEAVACESPGYPNRDVEGRVMYHNSHFGTEAEAWARIMDNAEAAVSLTGRDVEQARTALRLANRRAGAAAVRFAKVRDNHDAWLNSIASPR